MPLPKAQDMFDTGSGVELAERFEAFKAELNKSAANPLPPPSMGAGGAQHPVHALQAQLSDPTIVKALGPDAIASLQTQLASPDVMKDLTLTNPLATGYVAYDLEAPAKKLFPKMTPLRNRIPRKKGIGTARKFKRLTGITGSGTGGLGLVHPGITDSTQTAFGGVNQNRGPKIAYAGDEVSVPYKQFSMSDSVPWSAQFSGEGYEDYRQVSQTSVLYSSMLMEERMLLGGRGTASGFSGALAAPANVAVSTPAASGSQTAVTGALANVWVKVTAESIFGQSVLSSAATSAFTAGDVITVTFDDVVGAYGYRVYVSTHASADPGDAGRFYQARGGSNTITITGALATSGVAANTVTADTSAQAEGYDGLLAYCLGPQAGYVRRLNGSFDAANPGTEFNTAFSSLWDSVKADPDEIYANGLDRIQLSDLLKTSSSSNYRITIDNNPEAHGAQLGTLVNAIQNGVTGKVVNLTVHPWMPQGVMPIVSWTLPIPDTEVSDVFAAVNVTDYQSVQWPVSQFSYEVSSYWYGTFICYAPAWCGAIAGIR